MASIPFRQPDISTFYTVAHPDEFQIDWRSVYEGAWERTLQARRVYRHELDIAYGSHPRQIMDIYFPEAASPAGAGAPVLLFMHGGGFREGDPALYGYLAPPFVDEGAIFVSAGYRLIPEVYFPESAVDAQSVIGWLYQNIRGRGGDPDRIFVTGHSAGAIQTAHVTFKNGWTDRLGVPRDVIKGAAPISGLFDFREGNWEFYRDESKTPSERFLDGLEYVPRHSIIAYGTEENSPEFARQGPVLGQAIAAKGGSVEVLELQGQDHADTVLTMAQPDSELCLALKAMLKR